MKIPLPLPCIFAIALMTSCKQYAYYQSPLQANDHSYKAIPLKSDSLKTATYLSGHFMAGGANYRSHDNVFGFSVAAHRAHDLGIFQAWYGAQLALGNYHVNKYLTETSSTSTGPGPYRAFDATAVNATAGNKFFGAWGAAGGIDVVMPGRYGGEWRVLAVELYFNNEFGNYYNFRQKLPPGAANTVSHDRSFLTAGYFTEIIGNKHHGKYVGYKVGVIASLKELRPDRTYDEGRYLTPACVSQTLHFTSEGMTAYVQANLGSYTASIQTGVNIRLNIIKKAGR